MCLVYTICARDEGGFKGDQERLNKSGIKIGDKIRVLEANVSGWYTDIYLEGYEGRFNSVFFDYVDRDEKPYNIYRKPGFYEFYKEI